MAKIFTSLEQLVGGTPLLELRALLEDSKLPGMKVLEFAFDHREPSDYLPHNYPRSCVCYAGTHDNDTLLGWLCEVSEADLDFAVS